MNHRAMGVMEFQVGEPTLGRNSPQGTEGGERQGRNTGIHRFALLHPAARACDSEQNQRSPFDVSMRVRS